MRFTARITTRKHACLSIHTRFINSVFFRAFGDWRRRQSAIDTRRQPLPVDPRISERKQNLESILRTTRWPTKNNVSEELKAEEPPFAIPNPASAFKPLVQDEEETNSSEESHCQVIT